MTEYRCNGELNYPADAFFCFTITIRRPILQMSLYSEYQYFLYETISKLREKGITFNQIADHLNKKKILSVRGLEKQNRVELMNQNLLIFHYDL